MENEEIDLEEQVQNKKCGCSHKKKERSKGEAKKLINRLNRIEGQVRGDQENAGTGRILYGYFDPSFRGERGIEQLQQRIAGRTYPHLCGRRHPAGKR